MNGERISTSYRKYMISSEIKLFTAVLMPLVIQLTIREVDSDDSELP